MQALTEGCAGLTVIEHAPRREAIAARLLQLAQSAVRKLRECGLESLYHYATGEAQGAETAPTYYRHRRHQLTSYIDFSLTMSALDGSPISVGDSADWPRHSDQVLLVADIASLR
jgi:hypothetical protein